MKEVKMYMNASRPGNHTHIFIMNVCFIPLILFILLKYYQSPQEIAPVLHNKQTGRTFSIQYGLAPHEEIWAGVIKMPVEEGNTIVSGNDFSVDIFPNPVRDVLYYVIKGSIDMQLKITVSDVHGNITTKFKKPLDAIAINDKIFVEKLTAGIYFITFSNGLNQQTFKFLKIK